MRPRYHAPGVTVVALVPSAGPVPPPTMVVMPAASASSRICGQMRCTWQSTAPAVRMRPSPASTSVDGPMTSPGCTPSVMSGLPALPTATIRLSRTPTSAFTTPHQSSTTTLVMTRSMVERRAWPMDSRITLPPPNTASSPGPPEPIVRSSVGEMSRFVSPKRTLSPTVGPYSSA